MPSSGQHSLIYIMFELVDFTQLGNQYEWINDLSTRFCTSYMEVVGIDIDGFSGSPHVTIGSNSPDFNDLVPDTNIAGVTSTDDCQMFVIGTKGRAISIGQNITLNVKAKTNSTRYLANVYLIGQIG